MEMQTDSGKNYADLRKRFERVRGLTIGIERTIAGVDTTVLSPVIRRSALPSSVDVDAERRGQKRLPLSNDIPYGIEFDEEFFGDVERFHVPVPSQLLSATRKQSQLQDICLFLHWRCFAARTASVIPWESLRQQLWHADKTARRIKVRVAEAIAFLRTICCAELQAEARPGGLSVAPPKNGAYLFPQAKEARRLRVPQSSK